MFEVDDFRIIRMANLESIKKKISRCMRLSEHIEMPSSLE